MKLRHAASAALLLAAPAFASAEPLSYTWIDAALSHDNADLLKGGNGYQLSGSYGFAGHFFVDASYAKNDYGQQAFPPFVFFQSFDVEEKASQFGAGVHFSLSDTTDFVARFNFSHYSDDPQVQHFYRIGSESGNDLGVGLRTLLTQQLEMDVFLDHNTADFDVFGTTQGEGSPDNVLSAGLRWHITSLFYMGLAYESSSATAKRRTLLSAGWNF